MVKKLFLALIFVCSTLTLSWPVVKIFVWSVDWTHKNIPAPEGSEVILAGMVATIVGVLGVSFLATLFWGWVWDSVEEQLKQ